jgi:hypothetical protein
VTSLRQIIGRALYEEGTVRDCRDWAIMSDERREPWCADGDRVVRAISNACDEGNEEALQFVKACDARASLRAIGCSVPLEQTADFQTCANYLMRCGRKAVA